MDSLYLFREVPLTSDEAHLIGEIVSGDLW